MAVCIGKLVQCPICFSFTFGYLCNPCNQIVCSCEPHDCPAIEPDYSEER